MAHYILLSQAAERVGRSKDNIKKLVINGRIKGDKDNDDGFWQVDEQSLLSYYGLSVGTEGESSAPAQVGPGKKPVGGEVEVEIVGESARMAATGGRVVPDSILLKTDAVTAYQVGQLISFYESELASAEVKKEALDKHIEIQNGMLNELRGQNTFFMEQSNKLLAAPKKEEGTLTKKWLEPATHISMIVIMLGSVIALIFVFFIA